METCNQVEQKAVGHVQWLAYRALLHKDLVSEPIPRECDFLKEIGDARSIESVDPD